VVAIAKQIFPCALHLYMVQKFLILTDFVVMAKVRHDRLKLHHEPSHHASKTVYQNQS